MSVQFKKTAKFGIFSIDETLTVKDERSIEENFDIIFANVSYDRAKDASLEARSKMSQIEKIGLTYGEVKLEAMKEIFRLLKLVNPKLFATSGGKFYDLGSGSGRPVVMAALLHQFHSCVGIEIIPALDELAQEALACWSIHKASINPLTSIQFYLGSITDLSCCNWTDGDIVFTNSTAFSTELFETVANLATAMKPGSLFVSFTADIQDTANFIMVQETRLEMSWGMADVYIHRRL